MRVPVGDAVNPELPVLAEPAVPDSIRSAARDLRGAKSGAADRQGATLG